MDITAVMSDSETRKRYKHQVKFFGHSLAWDATFAAKVDFDFTCLALLFD